MNTTAAGTKLTGRRKAAMLLIALGSELSAEVLKHFPETDIETLTVEVFNLEKISEDSKDRVLEECYQMALARKFITSGGADYARQMLEKALGKQKADELLDRLATALRPQPFDFLRETDPVQLASFIQGEHPQTIAFVLAHLNPLRASAVLTHLPPDLQPDVAMRIATMDRTPPDVVAQVEDVLRARLSTPLTDELRSVGGIEFLVKVLTNADRWTEKTILDSLDEADPELAAEVRKLMFTFENLVRLDSRSLQRVLREVDGKDLALALRGASEELRQHIFRNLSTRAAEMLKEEIDTSGPVRLRQVQAAQQRVVSIVRRLDEAEEIVIQRGGDDVLV